MANVSKVGSEFLVNTQTTGFQDSPQITTLSNGNFVMTWEDRNEASDGSGSSVKAQIFTAAGAKIGGEFLVNQKAYDSQSTPVITALKNGGFAVSWQDYNYDAQLNVDDLNIKARIFNADGTQAVGEFQVNLPSANDQQDPTITTLANGNIVVSWENMQRVPNGQNGYSYTYVDVRAQILTPSGAKVGGEFVVSAAGEAPISPAVTSLANGGFVVSWTQQTSTGDGSGESIKARIFNASGVEVKGEFLVNSQTAGNQTAPAITALPNGNFVVSWGDSSGTLGDSNGSVKGQIFSASGDKVGSEFLVNSWTAGFQTRPAITALADGGFAATWTESGNPSNGNNDFPIMTQVFDAAGVKQGNQLQVSTSLVNVLGDSAVTALPNGNYVVSWENYRGTLGDGSDTSIVAQILRIDHDPVISSNGGGDSAAITVTENSTAVTTVQAADFDGQSVFYSISGADAFLFTIDSRTGVLTFRTAPDHEAPQDSNSDNVYELTVRANSGYSDYQALRITVADVNDYVPIIVSNNGQAGEDTVSVGVRENEALVTTVNAMDLDSKPVLRYTIIGGDDAGLFTLDATTGALRFVATPPKIDAPTDANHDNIYDVLVRASDGANADTQRLRIMVVENGVTITGTEGDDVITPRRSTTGTTSTTGDDTIYGLGGKDKLDGGIGADSYYGGSGDDKYVMDNVGDRANEDLDAGKDTVQSATTNLFLYQNIENGKLLDVRKVGADLNIFGNELANVLTGNSGRNALNGREGNDKLNGKGGDDFLSGDDGDDVLTGGDGADFLQGGLGKDILNGGSGFDTLSGGIGADQFKFDKDAVIANYSPADRSMDYISDFNRFEGDRINLSAIDANGNPDDGNQKFTFIGTDAFSGSGQEVRYITSPFNPQNTVIEVDIDGVAGLSINLRGIIAFTAGDFIL